MQLGLQALDLALVARLHTNFQFLGASRGTQTFRGKLYIKN